MKKIPKTWLFPTALEREYCKDLTAYAKRVVSRINSIIHLRQDSQDEEWRAAMLRALMDLPRQIEAEAEQVGLSARVYADKIARFNDTQYHNVVKSVVGMDFAKPEPWLQQALDNWTAENARLIKSIPEQQIGKVQQLIAQAAVNGTSQADLIAQLKKIEHMPIDRAALIASDQVGKLNSQLTRMRQQAIGIKQYRWRGKLDDRERDHHVKREGKIFDWDNPPSGGHPGSEIRCRCHAQAIFPELAELDAQFFGDGSNRHYNAQMQKRGLMPESGGANNQTDNIKQIAEKVKEWVAQGVVAEAIGTQIAGMIGSSLKATSVAQSVSLGKEVAVMRSNWDNFPEIIVVNHKASIAEHSAYKAAKSGDLSKAIELVNDYLDEEALSTIRNLIEPYDNVVLLPVHAIEENGRNKLPIAYAAWLSNYLNISIDDEIVQSNKVGRTGSDGFDRLIKSVTFDGRVVAGQRYLLIDDAVTQGGTLADLKGYIESSGGIVIGASVLMGKPHSAKLAITKSTLGLLRKNLGKDFEAWWIKEFGYDFSKFTESEARYINKQITRTSPDAVRDTLTTRRFEAIGKRSL